MDIVDRRTAKLRRAPILNERWFDKPQRSICRPAATALSSAMIAKTMATLVMFNFHLIKWKINTIRPFNIKFFRVSSNNFQ